MSDSLGHDEDKNTTTRLAYAVAYASRMQSHASVESGQL